MAQPPSHGRGPVLLVLQLRLAPRLIRGASARAAGNAGTDQLRI